MSRSGDRAAALPRSSLASGSSSHTPPFAPFCLTVILVICLASFSSPSTISHPPRSQTLRAPLAPGAIQRQPALRGPRRGGRRD
eukprot:5416858-Pyramimonas_sp.AAC.1